MPVWSMPSHPSPHAIAETVVTDANDVLYYVPLVPDKSTRGSPNRAACVRHSPRLGTIRCEACRSRSCLHVGRLRVKLGVA